MDYAAHYTRLIERARGRVLPGYKERHHVLPRCMGGGNEAANLVDLTAEEHFVAHQLLVKMHPASGKLAHAANMMANKYAGNKPYGWVRRRLAEAMRITMTGKSLPAAWRASIAAGNTGKPLAPERRAKIAAALLGRPVVRSAEAVARIAAAARARMLSDRNPMKGHAAAARRGVPLSSETRAKLSLAGRRYKATPETRQKQSVALRGKKHAPAHAAKLAAHLQAYWRARRAAEGQP